MLNQKTPTFITRSIRQRLILSFALVVLAPMMIVSIVLAVSATQNAQTQLQTELETIMSYKKTAITELIIGLQSQLKNSVLGEEVDNQISRLLLTPTESIESQKANLFIKSHFRKFLAESVQFQSFSIINLEGQVVLSTDSNEEGKDYKNEVFFQGSQFGPFTHLSAFTQTIIVTRPLKDWQDQIIGYVAAKASTATLNKIMQNRDGLGQTGQTYLVSNARILLTDLPNAEIGTRLESAGIIAAVESQTSGTYYSDSAGNTVFGIYGWIPEIRTAIIAEKEQTEAFGPIYGLLSTNFGVAILAVALAIILSLYLTRSIAQPLGNLAETATKIADGEMGLKAEVSNIDEIDKLGTAFNNMTGQLRQTLENLEVRVKERTNDLEERTKDLENRSLELAQANEQVKRRIIQMETISRVAKSIASVQNLQELLPFITQVINEQFGFYHAGVFLVDSANEYAVLSAANSEGGQKMLARNHKLRIGPTSIVGYTISNGSARVVLDTENDAVFSVNPDLPNTKSEMALPLRIGENIIGALDVQSTQPGAFTEQDTEALSTLADQVSIAIQNSRLFESTQKSLSEINTLYRQTIRQTWDKTIGEQEISGYKFNLTGNQPLKKELKTEGTKQALEKDELVILQGNKDPELATPIKLRGQTIGVLNIVASEGHIWKQKEINILRAIAERVSVAAENARLFEETSRRAERERAVATITAKIRNTNDPEEMLSIAMNEIKNALNAREIRVKTSDTPEQNSENQ
jgi:GAF domain-containing protein/HAMP domain-containing protein